MNQAEFMHEFNDTHREHFNADFFKRDNQELVDSLRLVVESVERDKYFTLKLLSFETIWVDLESLSKISQTEKDKLHGITYM